MLIVVSPAKTLDYESPLPSLRATQPRLLDEKAALRRLVILLRRAVGQQVVETFPLDVVEIYTKLLHVRVGDGAGARRQALQQV